MARHGLPFRDQCILPIRSQSHRSYRMPSYCGKEVGVIYPPNASVSKGWNSLPYLFVNEQYLWKEDNVSSKYLLRTEENAETHIDYILTFIKSAKLMKKYRQVLLRRYRRHNKLKIGISIQCSVPKYNF